MTSILQPNIDPTKHMKSPRINAIYVIAAMLALFAAFQARAATWSDFHGIGNPADDPLIQGSAARHNVIANIQSNYLWFATSAKSSGSPMLNQISFWTDMTRPLLDVWIATNSYTLTNTSASPTNVFSLSTTNGIAANDVLLLRNIASDSYQLIVVSNGPAFPLVSYTSVTNGYSTGDIVYKLARVQQVNPAWWNPGDNFGTNSVNLTKTNYYVLPSGFKVQGRLGYPLVVGTFATNHAAAWMHVSGEYYVRPRR